MQSSFNSKSGFTLVEILSVVSIIAVIAVVVLNSASNSTEASQTAAMKRQEQMINSAYQSYLAAGGKGKASANEALDALVSTTPIEGAELLAGPFLLSRPPESMQVGNTLYGLGLTGTKFAYATGVSGGTGTGQGPGGESSGGESGSGEEENEEGNEPPFDAFAAALTSITDALNSKATLLSAPQELWDSQVQAITSAYDQIAGELGDPVALYGPSGSFNVPTRALDPYYQDIKQALEQAYQDYLVEWERAQAHPPIPGGGKGTGSLMLGSGEALRNSELQSKLKNPYTGMAPTVTTDPVVNYLLSQVAPAGTELVQFRRFIDGLTAE